MLYLMLQILFWLCLFLLAYVYTGYPLLLIILSHLGLRKPHLKKESYPKVSLLIAAYNEEACIREKIENSLALGYPRDLLEIIVVSDCSTDNTDAIVQEYSEKGVILKRLPQRGGQIAARNSAVSSAQGEILIFSDTSTMFDKRAVKELVFNFADSRVGCVSGKDYSMNKGKSGISVGEGTYFDYEHSLRNMESSLGLLTGVSGNIYALRRELFTSLDSNLPDDFVVPLNVWEKGYRVIHEPKAKAGEIVPTTSVGSERVRRRIVNWGLRGLRAKKSLLNPFKFSKISFELISHRLLRWLSPMWLILVFGANVALTFYNHYYSILLGLQLIFYFMALLGCWSNKSGKRFFLLDILFYFVISNKALLLGLIDFLRGKGSAMWEPVER